MKNIFLPPTWYSPVCSALQRLSSYRGKFDLLIGSGDFSDSRHTQKKSYLDTAVTSGHVYRQTTNSPVTFFPKEAVMATAKQCISKCPFLV